MQVFRGQIGTRICYFGSRSQKVKVLKSARILQKPQNITWFLLVSLLSSTTIFPTCKKHWVMGQIQTAAWFVLCPYLCMQHQKPANPMALLPKWKTSMDWVLQEIYCFAFKPYEQLIIVHGDISKRNKIMLKSVLSFLFNFTSQKCR